EYLNLSNKQKVVINLWHIETFEGGSNSRAKFLEKQAIKFNKENNNCFISVSTLTEEQLFLNLKENKLPDMFSFAVGSGYLISSYLQKLDNNSQIRKDLINYGKIGDNLIAYPYILSGYCVISHNSLLIDDNLNNFISNTTNKKEIKGITYSKDNFINTSKVLIKNNYKNLNKSDYLFANSTYEAYLNFINKKSISLLGTARDVSRCKNREKNGKLSSCKYIFLPNYSDLIQYVGVSKTIEKEKKNYALEFSKFLTLPTSQLDLKNYGLFSTTDVKLYKTDYMCDFEDELKKELTSINVFTNKKDIDFENENCFNNLFNV
ncbi:MAG: hypothetical protein IJB10_02410, partial [Clostridia bacterium]|nr:hypothetical protein [Clostridia bacterium]